ncbi:f420-dependent NADP reductase [Cadophora sp. MPI-SDFR-AT-0126]|nr:f420-dependent NADP reductase [Leotiomycetes sp. MPI-SDFR-AT-0126]
MRIAIAGSGDIARYLSEEILKASLKVTILSRRPKPDFPNLKNPNLVFKIVDFTSQASLDAAISNSDALVSTLADWTMELAEIQLRLLTACQNSPKCKRFIPSEFGGNLDSFPDIPAFYSFNRIPVRQALEKQTEVEWTLLNIGWIADYQVPARNRYVKNIGPAYPVDFEKGVMVIPGTEDDEMDFASARDMSKAIVALCLTTEKWEPITYAHGERTTWNRIRDLLAGTSWGKDLKVTYVGKEELERVAEKGTEEEKMIAEFNLQTFVGTSALPVEKTERQKEKYFKGIHFRKIGDLIKEVQEDADKII